MTVRKKLFSGSFSVRTYDNGETWKGFAEVRVHLCEADALVTSYTAVRETEDCESFFEAWVRLAELVFAIVIGRRS